MTSQNYGEPQSTFEWGTYTVQYAAAKTRNALTSECVFTVSVLRELEILKTRLNSLQERYLIGV